MSISCYFTVVYQSWVTVTFSVLCYIPSIPKPNSASLSLLYSTLVLHTSSIHSIYSFISESLFFACTILSSIYPLLLPLYFGSPLISLLSSTPPTTPSLPALSDLQETACCIFGMRPPSPTDEMRLVTKVRLRHLSAYPTSHQQVKLTLLSSNQTVRTLIIVCILYCCLNQSLYLFSVQCFTYLNCLLLVLREYQIT